MNSSALTRTRFAPTPSGFLHLGNICNLLLIHCYRKMLNLHLSLRIDDIDRSRYRVEYLENIFQVSDFLGISYDAGPSGVSDFEQHFSQGLLIENYRSLLDKLREQTFLCACTRKKLKDKGPIYPGFCRDKKIESGENLKTRLIVQSEPVELRNQQSVLESGDCAELVGDFILWNSLEDRPSYQLVSFYHDVEDKVDFIIRGEDLCLSTISQEVINEKVSHFGDFSSHQRQKVSYLHHSLIKKGGQKISKTVNKNSSVSITNQFSASDIYSYFWEWVSGEEKRIDSLSMLESLFFEHKKTPSIESVNFR